MIGMEQSRQDVQKSLTDGAIATAPHIVNGLTVRPRKQINLWLYGLLLLPDFAALLVLGMHRLLRYFGITERRKAKRGFRFGSVMNDKTRGEQSPFGCIPTDPFLGGPRRAEPSGRDSSLLIEVANQALRTH
jgi:hypothetical protein